MPQPPVVTAVTLHRTPSVGFSFHFWNFLYACVPGALVWATMRNVEPDKNFAWTMNNVNLQARIEALEAAKASSPPPSLQSVGQGGAVTPASASASASAAPPAVTADASSANRSDAALLSLPSSSSSSPSPSSLAPSPPSSTSSLSSSPPVLHGSASQASETSPHDTAELLQRLQQLESTVQALVASGAVIPAGTTSAVGDTRPDSRGSPHRPS